LARLKGHTGIATLIRNKKQEDAEGEAKAEDAKTSPEKTQKLQEDADRAMKELLEEEEKAAAAAAAFCQKKKQAKERRRKAADRQDGRKKEEHAEEENDTVTNAESEKKSENVAAKATAAALKEKVEERVWTEKEEGKPEAAERKDTEVAASQVSPGRGLSQDRDDDGGQSPAKSKSSKLTKKKAGIAQQCREAGREGCGVDKALGIPFAVTTAAEQKAEEGSHFTRISDSDEGYNL
jgi:hypothetical protein